MYVLTSIYYAGLLSMARIFAIGIIGRLNGWKRYDKGILYTFLYLFEGKHIIFTFFAYTLFFTIWNFNKKKRPTCEKLH
jgi:hypothetical protein